MYCKCGCGGKTAISKVTRRKNFHTAGFPVYYIRGHNSGKPIEDYIIQEPNSGCHLWVGDLDSGGYGRRSRLGKWQLAHRLMYEIERGKIQDGMTIDHLCRIRSCVNTRHMEIVTRGENTLRGNGPAAVNFRKKFCPRCYGPYTKNKKQRVCVNCVNSYQRKQYAIKKQLGGQMALVIR